MMGRKPGVKNERRDGRYPPGRPIIIAQDLDWCTRTIDELLALLRKRDLGKDEQEYLRKLADLAEEYEGTHP